MPNLLLIESPKKIQKLQQILGKSWVIKASLGHIRELASDGEDALGFDLSGDTVNFRFVPRSQKAAGIVKELKQIVTQVEKIYIATDPDREGETIGWHLAQVLRLKNPQRVTYREITESAIKEAIANPRPLDLNPGQQANLRFYDLPPKRHRPKSHRLNQSRLRRRSIVFLEWGGLFLE